MHCFAGDADEIPPFTRLGFFVAFGGTATFPRNEKALRAAAACPEDRIVFETDAPYLAPQRWRGRRNEPAFIVEAARLVCDVRGVPYENLEETSDANAARLFAFAGAPQPA